MSDSEFLPDFNSISHNISQDQQLALHRKHIRALWHHLQRLEKAIHVQGDGSVTIAVGTASIALKKNGDITIKGKNIEVSGHGQVTIKGAKILQN